MKCHISCTLQELEDAKKKKNEGKEEEDDRIKQEDLEA